MFAVFGYSVVVFDPPKFRGNGGDFYTWRNVSCRPRRTLWNVFAKIKAIKREWGFILT